MSVRSVLTRILVCIGLAGGLLYSYIDQQNEVTRLRLQIPRISKDIRDLQERNTQLQYQIDRFESPENLMQLAANRSFSHLQYPAASEVWTLEEGLALQSASEAGELIAATPHKAMPVVGTLNLSQ